MLLPMRLRAFAPFLLAVTLVIALSCIPSAASAKPGQPDSAGFERAHAHNDYEHDRPLFDTLDHNFKSVEADVWLANGELLVAHDRHQVQPGRRRLTGRAGQLVA